MTPEGEGRSVFKAPPQNRLPLLGHGSYCCRSSFLCVCLYFKIIITQLFSSPSPPSNSPVYPLVLFQIHIFFSLIAVFCVCLCVCVCLCLCVCVFSWLPKELPHTTLRTENLRSCYSLLDAWTYFHSLGTIPFSQGYICLIHFKEEVVIFSYAAS